MWALAPDVERFDKAGVRWSLPVCEALDGTQRAVIHAIKEAGTAEVGPDDPLAIVLHNSGLDVNFLYYGQSPLFLAANTGARGVVDMLLRWPHPVRIDANLRNDAGETPLLAACRGGHVDIVRLLMKREDVDPNLRAADGTSPLWWACHNGHVDVVRWFLDEAEPGAIDWGTRALGLRGLDPPRTTSCIEVARLRGHLACIPLVEEGTARYGQLRARDRLKKASEVSKVAVRIRDAEGVFFGVAGAPLDLDTEMGREHHDLGDQDGVDYHDVRRRHEAQATRRLVD